VRGPDHRTYGQVAVAGHLETYELKSAAFRNWLNLKCREGHRSVPTVHRIHSFIRAFEADAAALRSTGPVWVRVADGSRRAPARAQPEVDGSPDGLAGPASSPAPLYYLDLGDASWRSVETRAEGCRIVQNAPVVFWRSSGFGALPEPPP